LGRGVAEVKGNVVIRAQKTQFWIFPNLTEDVGFLESFWPIYVYTYTKPKKVTRKGHIQIPESLRKFHMPSPQKGGGDGVTGTSAAKK
jgi:hypothetical protein